MKNKVTIKKGTVQETLTFPLYGRAICNSEHPEVFKDTKAKEIMARMDYDFSNANMGKGPTYVYGMRGEVLSDAAKGYIEEYPDAIIVNLGCGLDTSFYQIDNGKMRYVNLDFPEVIDFREQLFDLREREMNLGMNAMDFAWMDKIGAGPQDHVFVITGGVFFYFKPEDVKKLIRTLSKKFPNGGIMFDYENEKMMQKSNSMVKKSGNKGAEMFYSVNDAETEIPAYTDNIADIKFMKKLPAKYGCIPGIFKFFFNLEFKKGMMGFANIRFKGDYHFWGWEQADAKAITDEYKGINTPIDLYNALSHIWCVDTCAPRMRNEWTKDNMTLGQCSITAFLAQDIFGGKVYGILRAGGNYHCYNVIGDCRFDLTSEQFGEEVLNYDNNPEQFREVHFAKEEKRLRYEYLKSELKKYCEEKKI